MYHVKDMLGSHRATVDSSGYVVGFEDFTPFGEMMQGCSFNYRNPNDIYKFTGLACPTCRKRDAETGLDYMLARNYDPEIGRFLSVDPSAGDYPGWSPYHYAANNPISITDPTGKNWYLDLHKGRISWIDGDEDLFHRGLQDLGYLNGLKGTTKGDLEGALTANGYGYTYSDLNGLSVDTKAAYKAWKMMMFGEGLIIGMGYYGVGANQYLKTAVSMSRGQELLRQIKHPKLRNIVRDLFREKAKLGDGSSMAAYKIEGSHLTKIRDTYNGLKNIWQSKEVHNLSARELKILDDLIYEIEAILGVKK